MIRLVVTADDFGASAEVNAAVARAHREGILTSASLMVTGAAAAEAIRIAKETPSLAVGLHLVLAQGMPAAPRERIAGLVVGDRLRDHPVWAGFVYAWQSILGRGRAELRCEIEAQLAAFRDAGLDLAHLDGHLNMHLHPMVLPILLDVGPRYGLRAMRLTRDDLGRALRHDRRHVARKLFEELVFRTLSARAVPRLTAAGVRTTDRVYGLHQSGRVDEAFILGLIPDLPAGVSELYCHPVVAESAVGPGGHELAALTSARVRAAIDRAGVELVSYRELS